MKRVQTYLILLGCVAAFTGTLALALAGSPSWTTRFDPQPLPTPDSAVYVGASACFTCHKDLQEAWTQSPSPRLIDGTVSDPHAVAVNTETFAMRFSATGSQPNASSNRDSAPDLARGRQQYIVQTDAGNSLLPGQWDAVQPAFEDHGITAPDCADCHPVEPLQTPFTTQEYLP